jgi:hypothetical protein
MEIIPSQGQKQKEVKIKVERIEDTIRHDQVCDVMMKLNQENNSIPTG